MENFLNNQADLSEAIQLGFEMILSIENDTRGKYLACYKENYKEVFEEVIGREFNNDCDIVFPITETLF